jgi:hypothetical protein
VETARGRRGERGSDTRARAKQRETRKTRHSTDLKEALLLKTVFARRD